MARIEGIDLPNDKPIEIALTHIFGIGRNSSKDILKSTNVDPSVRVKNLTEADLVALRDQISSNYQVEGDLRREVQMNIKRLMDMASFRGIRHRRSLPLRGQRTKTNARTRKGPRKPIRK